MLMLPTSFLTFVSLILLHLFIPFFILCLDVIDSPEHENLEVDRALIVWISDVVKKAAEERPALRSVMIIMSAMTSACQRVKSDGQ